MVRFAETPAPAGMSGRLRHYGVLWLDTMWRLMFSFQHQGLDLRNADVGFVGLGIDREQGDAVAELRVIDHTEAAALAAPSSAIGQAYFVEGVSDTLYALAGALVPLKLVDQTVDGINCLGILSLKPINFSVKLRMIVNRGWHRRRFCDVSLQGPRALGSSPCPP